MPADILWFHIRSLQTACGYSVVTYTKFTDCLWIFCGYIYEVYSYACEYSVVTHTKFTDCL